MKKILFLLLFSITTIAQPKKIYFFGDSITRGVLVSPTENYAELVAKGLGLQKVNNAISGTCMMSSNSCL
jgi:lysophospholipase L1-like esterase